MKTTKANMDIRDYLGDNLVTQGALAKHMGISQFKMSRMLSCELTPDEKENLLRHIDAIVADRRISELEEAEVAEEDEVIEETTETESAEEPANEDVTCASKFQIGDRVKIPSKSLRIGIISDVWHSLRHDKLMYAVDVEGGSVGLFSEEQLEPAPLPITYSFEAHIDGNVAVVTMNATQGEKEWIFARGHAHIIHDGEVGLAQAVSYAARRMFASLDTKQKDRIYFKGDK